MRANYCDPLGITLREERRPLLSLGWQNMLHVCPGGEGLSRHFPHSPKEATAFPLLLLPCGLGWNLAASSSSIWADKPQASHFLCVSIFLLAERIIKLPSTQECCSFNSLISIRSLEILSHKGLWKCQRKRFASCHSAPAFKISLLNPLIQTVWALNFLTWQIRISCSQWCEEWKRDLCQREETGSSTSLSACCMSQPQFVHLLWLTNLNALGDAGFANRWIL